VEPKCEARKRGAGFCALVCMPRTRSSPAARALANTHKLAIRRRAVLQGAAIYEDSHGRYVEVLVPEACVEGVGYKPGHA
jgi:hypothetical protein